MIQYIMHPVYMGKEILQGVYMCMPIIDTLIIEIDD